MNTYRLQPASILLDESAAPERVQILRAGVFSHPEYGTFEITSDVLRSMKKNFDANTRGVDLAIDYSHEADKAAAGWIKELSLESGDTELWALVDWTTPGKEVVEAREYRYFSADFAFEYTDNETNQNFGPTLFGAALTNRPCIKRMAPAIELTEIGGKKMEELKLAEEKITDLEKKLSESVSMVEDLSKKLEASEAAKSDAEKKLFDVQSSLDGYSPEELKMMIAKLKNQPAPTSELDGLSVEELKAMIADLQGKIAAAAADCATLKAANDGYVAAAEVAKKDLEFTTMLTEGKVVEAQRKAFLANDLAEFAKTAGKVNLKEQGTGAIPPEMGTGKLSDEQIIDSARKLLADKKAKDIGDAISKVLSEQK